MRAFRVSIAALAIIGTLLSGARASDESRGPEGLERERVYSIPVRGLEDGGFGVERVVVNIGGRLVGVEAGAGIVRQSQDRIRLRGVPVIGRVFMDRLTESDFTEAKQVGNVFVEDRSLFVDLSDGRRGLWFDTVVVVHGKFSYRFQDAIEGGFSGPQGDPRLVGKAYARDDTLLVLIRPTIITD